MFATLSSHLEYAWLVAVVSLGLFAIDILAMVVFWKPLFGLGIRIFKESRAYPGLPRASQVYPRTLRTPTTVFRFRSNAECFARVKFVLRTETRSLFPVKCAITFDGLKVHMEGRMSFFVPLFLAAVEVALIGPSLTRHSADLVITLAPFISPAIVIIMLTSSIGVERQRARKMLDEVEWVLGEVHAMNVLVATGQARHRWRPFAQNVLTCCTGILGATMSFTRADANAATGTVPNRTT